MAKAGTNDDPMLAGAIPVHPITLTLYQVGTLAFPSEGT